MIWQRTRGLQNMLLVCQSMLVSLLLMLVAVLMGTARLNLEHYPIYAVIVMIGLLVEAMNRERSRVRMNLWHRNIIDQHRVTLRQLAYGAGALLIYLAVMKDQFISRWFLFFYFLGLYGTLLVSNYYLPRLLARRIFRGVRAERTLLVGSGMQAELMKEWLKSKEIFGFQTVGILCDDASPSAEVHGFRCLGKVRDMEEVIRREGVSQVILLELPKELAAHRRIVSGVEKLGVRLLILSNLEAMLQHPVVHVDDDGFQFITLREEPLENPLNRIAKRALDLAVAIPAVVLVLPPLILLVWICQRLQSKGRLFYRQKRAGIQNHEFEIIKFRTMHENNPDEARQATVGDERVFPAGRWLRRMSLDEMPQFWNVLRGEMSVTGPRPHLIEHNEHFARQMSNYHIRAFVKPGITGLAQIRGFRGEARSAEEIARRLESDISYLENWRLALDVSIIARTAWQMFVPPQSAR